MLTGNDQDNHSVIRKTSPKLHIHSLISVREGWTEKTSGEETTLDSRSCSTSSKRSEEIL